MTEPNPELLLNNLRTFPKYWDGKRCILELKEADFQWRQMEWIGFYFEYLCRKYLSSMMEIPGPRYGNVSFDAFWCFPWDFKAHVEHDKHGRPQPTSIINDQEAIDQAISDYGKIGLIIASGIADYNDEDKTFKNWHEVLKGDSSNYVIEGRKRGRRSRLRKVSFKVTKYCIYLLDNSNLVNLGIYNQGQNSNTNPRPPKYKINLIKNKPFAAINIS